MGKGEIAPFPTVFSTFLENFLPFPSNLKLSSETFSVWKSLKFVIWERVKMIFVFDRIENIVGIGENAGYQMFSKAVLSRVIKSLDCVVKS